MSEDRDRRIVRWVQSAVDEEENDLIIAEQEVFWGVFVVDASDTSPLVMFSEEKWAEDWVENQKKNSDFNGEYVISPCVIDIMHRDNFEVPK